MNVACRSATSVLLSGGWTAGRSVGHCEPCFKAKKLLGENSDCGKGRKANNGRDKTNNPEKYG